MRFLFSAMLLCTLSLQCTFCGEETSASPPPYLKPVPPDALMAEPYDWELSRRAVPSVTDLVLIYGGGHHRTPYEWDRERLSDYVTYTDPDGRTQWLFDGFLLLEIMDPDGNGGSGVKFADGYTYDGRPSGAADREPAGYDAPSCGDKGIPVCARQRISGFFRQCPLHRPFPREGTTRKARPRLVFTGTQPTRL